MLLKCAQLKNMPIKYVHKNKLGLSLIEVMAGLIIFTLLFLFVSKAYSPTATDSHNLLRGTTVAMNACNWYLNSLEQKIQFEGVLPDSELGENDITYEFKKNQFSDILLLRGLKATSNVKLENNLYNVTITFKWGNSESSKKNHHFELSRLIVQPNY